MQALAKLASLAESLSAYERDRVRKAPELTAMFTEAKSHMSALQPSDRAKVAAAMGAFAVEDEDLCWALCDCLERGISVSRPPAVAGIMAGLGAIKYRCVFLDQCAFFRSMFFGSITPVRILFYGMVRREIESGSGHTGRDCGLHVVGASLFDLAAIPVRADKQIRISKIIGYIIL